jgi:hypothetical protein
MAILAYSFMEALGWLPLPVIYSFLNGPLKVLVGPIKNTILAEFRQDTHHGSLRLCLF